MSETCATLHRLLRDRPRLGFPFEPTHLPRNGIYVLFEKGESGHGGDRIVRVGTHTGQDQLPSRLRQHFVQPNKDRSIFRKNIGRALLAQVADPYLPVWELDQTTRAAKAKHGHRVDRHRQEEIEREVSRRIQEWFTFTAFEVPGKAERLRIESRIVSTVSSCRDCGPTADWLGRHSPKAKIRQSGLWQVNELYKTPLAEAEMKLLVSLL